MKALNLMQIFLLSGLISPAFLEEEISDPGNNAGHSLNHVVKSGIPFTAPIYKFFEILYDPESSARAPEPATTQRPSPDFFRYARAHNILHFGKRSALQDDDSFSELRDLVSQLYSDRFPSSYPTDKRGDRQRTLMHEGNRPDYSNVLSEDPFGKRVIRNRFIHFGKRGPYDGFDWLLQGEEAATNKRANGRSNFIHFGKRSEDDFDESYDDYDEMGDMEKRAKANRFIHFGKRGNRYLHFGKRDTSNQVPPSQALNQTDAGEDSKEKRKNAIMHFGKRDDLADGSTAEHTLSSSDYLPQTADSKRAANRMIHFGKREPNRIMHFGKRPASNNIMHFGKRQPVLDEDFNKRASNRMLHFGKRLDDSAEFEEADTLMNDAMKRNRMLHFGKRYQDNQEFEDDKRASNRILHFGKRNPGGTYPDEAKRANRILHFGKRDPDGDSFEEELLDESKRANRILHFGKREPGLPDEGKRGNRILHFGKREMDEEGLENFDSAEETSSEETSESKRANRILHFGKRAQHRMIHFGKREDSDEEGEEKRAASNRILHFGKRPSGNRMLHFGKRDNDSDQEKRASNRMLHFGKRPSLGTGDRVKRSTDEALDEETIVKMLKQMMSSASSDKRFDLRTPPLFPFRTHNPFSFDHAFVAAQLFDSGDPKVLNRPSRSDRFFLNPLPWNNPRSRAERNIFLHFGKR